jgi:hypothetical protein
MATERYRKATITTCCGPVEAQVHPCGWLAYHPVPWEESDKAWMTISHIPSGTAIANIRTQVSARSLVSSLMSVAGLDSSTPPSSALHAAWGIVSSFRVPSSRRKVGRTHGATSASTAPLNMRPLFGRKVPTAAQKVKGHTAAMEFEALWSGTQTDPRLFLSALDQWDREEWRGEIVMAVVEQLRLLEDKDIPRLPPTLRDGSPLTPATFRARYDELMALGDRLQAGARKMLDLWAGYELVGELTVAQLDRFEKWDAIYREIAQQGWLKALGAAYCLDYCSPTFLANVEAKTGFLGRYEGQTPTGRRQCVKPAGVGLATFLRHPEIKEVAPVRRQLRSIAEEML